MPERLALFEMAEARLTPAGYARIGIDHFAQRGDRMGAAALSGRLRRNFPGYTTDRAEVLIGLGASSISRFPQGYVQNAAATAQWTRAVREGRLPAARGVVLSEDDRLRGEAIERLLCDLALIPELRPGARHLARLVAMEMDTHAVEPARHSVAV